MLLLDMPDRSYAESVFLSTPHETTRSLLDNAVNRQIFDRMKWVTVYSFVQLTFISATSSTTYVQALLETDPSEEHLRGT